MEPTIAGITPAPDIPSSITNQQEAPVTKKGKFDKIKEWFSQQSTFRKVLIIGFSGLCLALILAGGLYAFIIYNGYQHNKTGDNGKITYSPTPTPKPTPITKVDPLTGVTLIGDQTQNLNRPPLAVMIENAIPARPQTGLNQADLVYEALTEGGITRFMAVFLGNTPQIVGPVRSARTFFLDWESEYQAIYAHWGQNSDVAPSLTVDNTRNIDAIYQPGTDKNCASNPGLFCRDFTRDAPHNGYGFPQLIWNRGSSLGWNAPSTFISWVFKDDALVTARCLDQGSLNIDFMPYDTDYSVKWVYNKATNLYTRFDGTVQQIDRADNTPITTKNIVLQFIDGNIYTSSGGKDVYHLTTIGTGKASIFMDGKEIDGHWKKDSLTGRTTFTDATGAPVLFDKGRTWITVLVNNSGSFTVS